MSRVSLYHVKASYKDKSIESIGIQKNHDGSLLSDRGRVVCPRSRLQLERSLFHGTLTRSCPCLSWIEKDCGLDSISISVYSLSRRSIDGQALQIRLNSSISYESMMWKMFDDSDATMALTSNLSVVFIPFSSQDSP